jgi:hypothetical protein
MAMVTVVDQAVRPPWGELSAKFRIIGRKMGKDRTEMNKIENSDGHSIPWQFQCSCKTQTCHDVAQDKRLWMEMMGSTESRCSRIGLPQLTQLILTQYRTAETTRILVEAQKADESQTTKVCLFRDQMYRNEFLEGFGEWLVRKSSTWR